jgi:hypothetical protein
MKRLNIKSALVGVLGTLTLAISVNATTLASTEITTIDTVENIECKYRQCDATAKSTGNRCKHCVSKPSDYQCYQHKP